MKKTFLALAVIASIGVFTSVNALATEITKGRMIKHKEWTTGNVLSYSLKATTPKQMALKFKTFQQKTHPNSANISMSMLDSISPAIAETKVEITGTSVVGAKNTSNETKQYEITSQLCTDNDPLTACVFIYDAIELEAGGMFIYDINPVVLASYSKIGTHQAMIETEVMGGFDTSETSWTDSASLGTFEVVAAHK